MDRIFVFGQEVGDSKAIEPIGGRIDIDGGVSGRVDGPIADVERLTGASVEAGRPFDRRRRIGHVDQPQISRLVRLTQRENLHVGLVASQGVVRYALVHLFVVIFR